jgi:hypothetical protein
MASNIMDDIAKVLAKPVSRRQTFKLIGGGLAGAVMAALGIRASFGGLCAPGKTACGFSCCDSTQKCINNAICCPDNGSTACNGCCCPPGGTCLKSGCCAPPRVVCNGVCCATGEECVDGKCVPVNPSKS